MNYPLESDGHRQWDWCSGIPKSLLHANVEHLADLRAYHRAGTGELENPPDYCDRRHFSTTSAEQGGLQTVRPGMAAGCTRRSDRIG